MSGGYRAALVSVALVLVVLSIPPLRRRLLLVRALPAAVDVVVWIGFLFLCFSALAGVQSAKSTELAQSVARAALQLAGQGLDSVLASATRWESAHEPSLAFITVGAVALAWTGIVIRFATLVVHARQPQPRLGDWWVVNYRRPPGFRRHGPPPVSAAPPVSARAGTFLDARAAAAYAGVSRATLYRWARTGRLTSRRDGSGLLFSSGDLAALRQQHRGSGGAVRMGQAR